MRLAKFGHQVWPDKCGTINAVRVSVKATPTQKHLRPPFVSTGLLKSKGGSKPTLAKPTLAKVKVLDV